MKTATTSSTRSASRVRASARQRQTALQSAPDDGGSGVIIVSERNARGALASMAKRLVALQGLGVACASLVGLAAVFEEAAKSDAVPMMQFNGAETKIADVMDRARNKDPQAVYALNALRVENVDTYVRATLDLGSMFEMIPLAKTDQAMIDQTYRNPVNVRYSGEDGGTRTVKGVKSRFQTFINMRELHSDTFQYAVRDINLGTDVAAAAQATVDIAWDVKHKMNMELLCFMNGGTINGTGYGAGLYGNFIYTGTPLKRTMVLHPSINTANLPTTNLITNAVLGTKYNKSGNTFTFEVLKAIIDYTEGFRGVFQDGDLEPTGLIWLPSSEITGIFQQINPTGAFYNHVGEKVLNSYTKIEYGGRVWTLMGSPILPPGACYPVFGKKVGNIYTKAMLDFEHTETNVLKNTEDRTLVKVWNYATLEPWRVHALKIVYSSVAGAGVLPANL